MTKGEVQNLSQEDSIRKSDLVAKKERIKMLFWQFLILIIIVALWEYLTRLTWLVEDTFLDPFFISQPSQIGERIYSWVLGSKAGYLWPHLLATLYATFLGLISAVTSGFIVGLLLSQSLRVARVLNPFIVAMNSLPRIAIVPLITMIFGLGIMSKVVTAWFVVFFLVFFNSFKGGLNIEPEILDFCRTLGASNRQITWTVRVPNSLSWAFAALPNAVSFSLIGVVIAEFVGSTTGMGYLLIVSLATLNSADMFATIIILGAVGIGLVTLFNKIEKKLLHWAPEFRRGE
jgi:NitT/TauT family transport system permease protein